MPDLNCIPTIPVIYYDESILVVSKPAGLRTIRDGYHSEYPYLSNILGITWGKVWVVHRLDKETSGVMLFAKTAESHRLLNEQFKQRKIHKVYHTIVIGTPLWNELVITSPLKIDGDRKHRTVVNHKDGKPSRTECVVIKRLLAASLLEAVPTTGYTHQIRCHLSSVGFPILGDLLYDPLHHHMADTSYINAPLLLHAKQISFTHPMTNTSLTFTDPYPDEFSAWLDKLNK
jgi:RluA family pseudouridine synthase